MERVCLETDRIPSGKNIGIRVKLLKRQWDWRNRRQRHFELLNLKLSQIQRVSAQRLQQNDLISKY